MINEVVAQDMYTKGYQDVFAGDARWQSLATPQSEKFEWDSQSTYVCHPPYFENIPVQPEPVKDIH